MQVDEENVEVEEQENASKELIVELKRRGDPRGAG